MASKLETRLSRIEHDRDVRAALAWVKRRLEARGRPEDCLPWDARESAIEAEVLLAHVLRVDRVALFSHPERLLDAREQAKLADLLGRRLASEPLAYLVGHREFYGLRLAVDPRVLIPRPETEVAVERAIVEALRLGDNLRLADVGTGSGAIAIALAKRLQSARVYALDISPDALDVARANCLAHDVADRVALLRGDLLAPLTGPVHLVVANLPYVTPEELARLAPEVAREPRIALAAREGGLEHYFRLLDQVGSRLAARGVLVCEIAPQQTQALRASVRAALPAAEVGVDRDLAGRERVVWARLP